MKNIIIISTAIMFILAAITTTAITLAAGNIKKNDQQLTIKVKSNGCAESVVLASSADNCSGTEFAASCGKNGKDCVCMQNNKFVSWTVETDTRFELVFNGPSPFKSNCKMKSGNNGHLKCKIEAPDNDYDYDVRLESCPDQVYDPRIVLRTRD